MAAKPIAASLQVITTLESFGEVRSALTDAGVDINQEESGLVWAPLAGVEVMCSCVAGSPLQRRS